MVDFETLTKTRKSIISILEIFHVSFIMLDDNGGASVKFFDIINSTWTFLQSLAIRIRKIHTYLQQQRSVILNLF
jgi:hypothetical protein